MGGGDLNLKKSWAVNIMSNQRRTYDAEQKALAERKRAAEVLKEREEERAVEELRRLQMEATGKTSLIDPKVQWMYQDSKNGLESEASEAYLLGKRRVDQIILKQDSQQEDSKKTQDPLAGALTAKDISSKAALDPLLAIEKQRTANLQSLMADPIVRRRLMKDMARKDKDEEKQERRHRRHRDDSRDRSHRSKRRRYSDESEHDRRDRRRHRSDSPREERKRRQHQDENADEKHDRRSRRDDREYDKRDHRRYDGEEDGRRRRRQSYDDSSGRHEKRRSRDDSLDSRRERKSHGDDRRRDRSRSRSPYRPRRHDRPRENVSANAESSDHRNGNAAIEERAAKLAAMSANADDLEEQRMRRLAEMEARDAADKQREDRRRDKRGDKFVDDLRQQAESKGLGDRLQRASGGLARLDAV